MRPTTCGALVISVVTAICTHALCAQTVAPIPGTQPIAATEPAEPPVFTLPAATAPATEAQRLPEIVVRGRGESLTGIADNATEGYVGQEQLAERPLLRPAEVLEAVPGLVITQHSGPGKANQYFLRGFQLDHGTDFSTTLEGVPQNLPTNAHGQGYMDLNYLIPELIDNIEYRKGPYYADRGDFSLAGSADIHYVDTLPRGFLDVEGGSYGYARSVAADSFKAGPGHLLAAFEFEHEDGPWDVPDAYKKINGLFRYTQGDAAQGFSLTTMDYHGEWRATNQVAQRAIDEGLIDRFGSLNPTDAGRSDRYTVVGEAHARDATSQDQIYVYGTEYYMDLFNDFTYYLINPVRGDQFEQQDRRFYSGVRAFHAWDGKLFGRDSTTTIGLQARNDDINSGLYDTEDRIRYDTVETAHILETSVGVYVMNRTQWLPKFRTEGGLREDYYNFHVHDYIPGDSGDKNATIFSPSLNLIFGPWDKTEFYVSGGYGFHSNDARGVTSTVSPSTLLPAERVTPLTRGEGAEIGTRTAIIPGLQSTLSLWVLDLDSELVFDGDTAESVPSPASRRYGIEWGNYYNVTPWLTLDGDFSDSRARFREFSPMGEDVPESIQEVLQAGITIHDYPQFPKFFGSVRLRYFGPRPLVQDDSVQSNSSTIVDAQVGYRFSDQLMLKVDILNLFNVRTDDIQYYYTSRLPGEPAGGVADRHIHPAEPFEVRAGLTYRF